MRKSIKSLLISLFLCGQLPAYAETTYYFRNKALIIKTEKEKKPELKGQGMTFRANAKSSTKTIEGKLSTAWTVWVRGCGDVTLPIEEDEDTPTDKKIHNGDMVELRFSRPGSCEVVDWKKY